MWGMKVLLPIAASKNFDEIAWNRILTVNIKRCLIQSRRFWKRRQSVFPLFIGFVYSVIVVFCRCLCTRLWSLCWWRCLRCAKRCSLLRGCLLRSARRWILIGVLQRSFNGKSSSARIYTPYYLLCCSSVSFTWEIIRDSPMVNIVSQKNTTAFYE